MKNKSKCLFNATVILVACIGHTYCLAQKNKGFITLRVPIQYTWYTVQVSVAAEAVARGEQQGQSWQTAVQLSYERLINKHWSAELGLGMAKAVFNIQRGYNIRYMGDLQAYLAATNPNYYYSLWQVPVRVNYRVKQLPKMEVFVGASNTFNLTWRQHYGRTGKMTQFYFFSNAVQIHCRLRYQLTRKMHLGAEPTLQVYNQWSKDDVVYDYGLSFQQSRPAGVSKYYKQFFDAMGIALSLSYKL